MQRDERGFTLLEVLVSLLVLALGVLAGVAMVLNALHASSSSYLRQQAQQYSYDIVDQMRANSGVLPQNAYALASGVAVSSLQVDCQGNVCTGAKLAQYDKYQWLQAVRNLPGGDGSITLASKGAQTQVQVTINWSDAQAPGKQASLTMVTLI